MRRIYLGAIQKLSKPLHLRIASWLYSWGVTDPITAGLITEHNQGTSDDFIVFKHSISALLGQCWCVTTDVGHMTIADWIRWLLIILSTVAWLELWEICKICYNFKLIWVKNWDTIYSMKPTISRNRSFKLPEMCSLFSTAGGEHFLLSATQGISLLSWNDTDIFILDSR